MTAAAAYPMVYVGEYVANHSAASVAVTVYSRVESKFEFDAANTGVSELLIALDDDPHNKLRVEVAYESGPKLEFVYKAIDVRTWPDWIADPSRVIFNPVSITADHSGWARKHTYFKPTKVTMSIKDVTNLSYSEAFVSWLNETDIVEIEAAEQRSRVRAEAEA